MRETWQSELRKLNGDSVDAAAVDGREAAQRDPNATPDAKVDAASSMNSAIVKMRSRMPDGKWPPSSSVEFLDLFADMLGQRSYLTARRLCQHPRDRRFLLNLPSDLARIVFRPQK